MFADGHPPARLDQLGQIGRPDPEDKRTLCCGCFRYIYAGNGPDEGHIQVTLAFALLVREKNYNKQLFSHLQSDRLNILTIHAEVEGIVHKTMFADFITLAQEKGYSFVPLGKIVTEAKKADITIASIQEQIIPGREGWISTQHSLTN